ncbi:hypothetical protein, partial [Aeromonas caviae]|uniref:hypothetical protein n=1 Tax=Aeromonas caviae TaxID=648 RepID=UPI001CC4DC48
GSTYDLGNVSDSGSLSRYSKSTVRRHRRVSHFEVEFAEHYGKEQIERWVSTSEKISKIIPEVLKCNSPTEKKFWGDFKNLERVRNEIIHSKSNNSAEILVELFSSKIHKYIESSLLLLEYFIELDPCNPIFPLGFGKSQIRVMSLKNPDEYLRKIKE